MRAARDERLAALSRSPVPTWAGPRDDVARERLIPFSQTTPAGAYPPPGHDRFILDQLAFELLDAGERASLTSCAVVNGGFGWSGGRRRSECGCCYGSGRQPRLPTKP